MNQCLKLHLIKVSATTSQWVVVMLTILSSSNTHDRRCKLAVK